ncbi:MAG: BamA/TamA family outer membrane protein [Balneolaceae bacterium]
MKLHTHYSLLLFFLLIPVTLFSQVVPQVSGGENRGVQHIFVPLVAYTSDLGLVGGGVGQRIDYGEGVSPFRNSTEITLLASTKGLLSTRFSYDRTRTFGRDIRSGIDMKLGRFLNQNYFGLGNETRFEQKHWDDEAYFYEHRELRINYQVRIPLPGFHSGGQNRNDQEGVDYDPMRTRFEWLFLYEMVLNRPGSQGDGTLYEEEHPYGSGGGMVHSLGLGLLFEKRDSEFDPRKGVRYDFRFTAAPSFLGDYGYSRFSLNLRHYFPLLPAITLANQVDVQKSFGKPPFWDLPVIGSEDELRGYPEFRFRGESSWASNTELRAWFYEIEELQIKLGIHGFWDTGRVFQKGDTTTKLFSGLKHTGGFGGAATLFSPDLIVRADIGFSEDLYRIYFGIGYLF